MQKSRRVMVDVTRNHKPGPIRGSRSIHTSSNILRDTAIIFHKRGETFIKEILKEDEELAERDRKTILKIYENNPSKRKFRDLRRGHKPGPLRGEISNEEYKRTLEGSGRALPIALETGEIFSENFETMVKRMLEEHKRTAESDVKFIERCGSVLRLDSEELLKYLIFLSTKDKKGVPANRERLEKYLKRAENRIIYEQFTYTFFDRFEQNLRNLYPILFQEKGRYLIDSEHIRGVRTDYSNLPRNIKERVRKIYNTLERKLSDLN